MRAFLEGFSISREAVLNSALDWLERNQQAKERKAFNRAKKTLEKKAAKLAAKLFFKGGDYQEIQIGENLTAYATRDFDVYDSIEVNKFGLLFDHPDRETKISTPFAWDGKKLRLLNILEDHHLTKFSLPEQTACLVRADILFTQGAIIAGGD